LYTLPQGVWGSFLGPPFLLAERGEKRGREHQARREKKGGGGKRRTRKKGEKKTVVLYHRKGAGRGGRPGERNPEGKGVGLLTRKGERGKCGLG